jgi:hypothetical protein
MEAVLLLVLVPLAVLAGALLSRQQGREDERNLLRYRQAADAQFRTLVMPSDDPRLHFDGMQVEAVMDEETLQGLRLSPMALRTDARMPVNENLTARGPAKACETHRLSYSLNCTLNY